MEGYMLSKEFITQAGELLRENADVYGDMEKAFELRVIPKLKSNNMLKQRYQ